MFGKILVATVALCALASPVIAKRFQHPFGELREYHRHWLTVCPNKKNIQAAAFYERTCWASTFSGDREGNVSGSFPGNRLTVSKDRFTGRFKITFVASTKANYQNEGPVILRFSNGDTLSLTFNKDVVTNGNSLNEFPFADDAMTYQLIEKMRLASHMVMTLPANAGPQRIQFSMLGLRSAMEFISIQGRR
ncbi:hypothetical protein ACFQ14_14730 [Pseudahrensia aquimaris]|uniref:Invasion associated locus B (IalB) protein n=1 Tax=Pseudahrensia aquimaris TaxID=744461 RepID=A0ABW3FK77_9HYPH